MVKHTKPKSEYNKIQITDFAELQKKYTGATNKRKWIIINKPLLLTYLTEAHYKPAQLAKSLDTSYATIKRLLFAANLWHLAKIKSGVKGGRKRTLTIDKFGYKLADKKHDVITDRGEIYRRYEHQVIAEETIGRALKESEIVHHINLDKLDNNPENLFVCVDNRQHRRLHCQLEEVAGLAVKKNLIKFDSIKGYYLNE